MPSVLSVKQLETNICKLKPNTQLRGFVPKEAQTFDFIKGFSEKNGKFEIYSFWNSAKKLIARETIYLDRARNICKIFNRFEEDATEIDIHIYENGKETESIYETLIDVDNNEFYSSKEDLIKKNGKIVSCIYSNRGLKSGYKPSYIDYEYTWNGSVPKISCGRFLPLSSKEEKRKKDMFKSPYIDYLPILNSNRSIENVDNRIRHISKLLERKYDIEGIVKEDVKRVSAEQLKKDVTAHCSNTGEIEMADDITDTYDLLYVLGHEYQHCNDYIDMNRFFLQWMNPEETYKNYTDKEKSNPVNLFRIASLKKGAIKGNKKERELFHKLFNELCAYEFLRQTIGHDNMEIEKRAIKEGLREREKYTAIHVHVYGYLFGLDKTVKAKFYHLLNKIKSIKKDN